MYNISSRRSFLKKASLTSVATLACREHVSGGWFGNFLKGSETVDKEKITGIPDEWYKLDGPIVYQYGKYIFDLKLKHITPRMVIHPHYKSRRGIKNSLPPKKMWKKIGPTLKAIDCICDVTGTSVDEILSVYRSPSYNRAVRGNIGSYHMCNQAVDIRFNNMSSWKAAKTIRYLRDIENVFCGGVGRYRGFIHIDTRGVNADW